ncbi:MAG: M14 family metallopeptidase [Phycisphaerales bacterium]
MNIGRLCAASVLVILSARGVAAALPPELLTVAERSAFKATALHADVVEILDTLARRSPLAKRISIGTSTEGRDLPALVISDPPVRDAGAARQLCEDQGKVMVLAIGNIHAGEVDGKEALPMLARDLLFDEDGKPAPSHDLLKKLVIVFAPIYNADGNERVSPTNRPGQVGPEAGMGIRENARGRDLNRDFVKLEESETQGLVEFMNEWDPHVFVDCHTTNGSYHRYVLTYAGPKLPAGDAELNAWCRESFFPALRLSFEAATGQNAFWYGSFEGAFGEAERGHTRWETFPAEARYGTNYVGLRNRISVLSEAYAYATYKERVMATRSFVRSVLEVASTNAQTIRQITTSADERTASRGTTPEGTIAIRTRATAWPNKEQVLGYVEETRDGRSHSTGKPAEYMVDLMDRFEPTLTAPRPFAYLLPRIPGAKGTERICATLRRHGIDVEERDFEEALTVTTLRVKSIEQASRAFQGHVIARIDVTEKEEKRPFKDGVYFIRTDRPLGNLICYLLEPACEDGLGAWNAYDPWLNIGEELPVYRLMTPLPTQGPVRVSP